LSGKLAYSFVCLCGPGTRAALSRGLFFEFRVDWYYIIDGATDEL